MSSIVIFWPILFFYLWMIQSEKGKKLRSKFPILDLVVPLIAVLCYWVFRDGLSRTFGVMLWSFMAGTGFMTFAEAYLSKKSRQ